MSTLNQKASTDMSLTQQRQTTQPYDGTNVPNLQESSISANNPSIPKLHALQQRSQPDNGTADYNAQESWLSLSSSSASTSHTQQHQPRACYQPDKRAKVPGPQEILNANIPMPHVHQRQPFVCSKPENGTKVLVDQRGNQSTTIAVPKALITQIQKEHLVRPRDFDKGRETPRKKNHLRSAPDRADSHPFLLKTSLRYGSINWLLVILVIAALLGLVTAQEDCAVLNSWIPLHANSTGCCSQSGITCEGERITQMYVAVS
jgi:hypothetical protein